MEVSPAPQARVQISHKPHKKAGYGGMYLANNDKMDKKRKLTGPLVPWHTW